MKADDNDKLWELLGKARTPSVSPFFARNVLRAVRQEEDARSLPSRVFRRAFTFRRVFTYGRSLRYWLWRLTLAGTCAVAAVTTVGTMFPTVFVRHHHSAETQAGLASQIVGNPDYEVIKHLDELVADEESSLWLDDSAHSVQ
jgi:hypothetical protein